ncbi:hypothetical protein NDN08_007478 [Rhodosorus marinus]|uniref:Uncharacterized protein n=1 Tax=Rhodosorus marinus TaxID=101924 RepID=A0AAV8UXY7_9RHOD|nr:hypothetical protein NDN08_007478 [Rhodosorus marinus]
MLRVLRVRGVLEPVLIRRSMATASSGSCEGAASLIWNPVVTGQHGLESLHSFLSTSFEADWWTTLMVTSALIRLATLPLTIRFARHRARYGSIRNDLASATMLVRTVTRNDAERARVIATNLRRDALEKARTSRISQWPLHVPFHLALFVIGSLSVRRLALQKPAGFETGGIAWFQDLAVADPTWALPVISGACLLLIPEFAFRPAPETVVRENIKLLKDPERSKDISFGTKFTMLLQAPEVVDRLKIGMQVMTPLMFPIVSNLPAGVTLYWATSSSLSLLQTLCLNSDRFRKMIGISSFANSYKEKREETKASKFLREYTQAAKDVQKAKVLVEKRFGSSASSRHLKQIQQLIDAAQKRGVIENRLMAQMAVHQETGELFMTFTPNFKPNLPDKA